MDFYDPDSVELLRSIRECHKMSTDYIIDKEFYINYNSEW